MEEKPIQIKRKLGQHGCYYVGQEFIDIIKERYPNFTILGEIPLKRNAKTLVYCSDCKQQFEVSRRFLLENLFPCPVCSGHRIIKGYNDALTKCEWLKDYVKEEDKDYVSTLAMSSTETITFVCPNCGFNHKTKVKNIVKAVNKCPNCGDGVSYPNKYSRGLLKQLPIENHITEYAPVWANNKYRYDNYFEYNNQAYIVEMDGGYHNNERRDFKHSLQERIDTDKEKDRLVQKHNIIMIRIDATISSSKYLKEQFLKSRLAQIFDLTHVDWDICERHATKSLIKEVCDYVNTHDFDTLKEVADKFDVSVQTIKMYTDKGKKLGWCDNYINRKPHRKKHITEVYDINKKYIGTYSTLVEATKQLNLLYPNVNIIRNSIIPKINYNNELKTSYKGFYFVRKEKLS